MTLDHRLYVASPGLQCLSRRHLAPQSDPEHCTDLQATEAMQSGKRRRWHSHFSVLIAEGQSLQDKLILGLEHTMTSNSPVEE